MFSLSGSVLIYPMFGVHVYVSRSFDIYNVHAIQDSLHRFPQQSLIQLTCEAVICLQSCLCESSSSKPFAAYHYSMYALDLISWNKGKVSLAFLLNYSDVGRCSDAADFDVNKRIAFLFLQASPEVRTAPVPSAKT